MKRSNFLVQAQDPLETLTAYGAYTFWHIYIDVQADWLIICNKEYEDIVEGHKSYKVEFDSSPGNNAIST